MEHTLNEAGLKYLVPEQFLKTLQPYVFSRYAMQWTFEIYIIKAAPSYDSLSFSELSHLCFCAMNSSPEEFPCPFHCCRSLKKLYLIVILNQQIQRATVITGKANK